MVHVTKNSGMVESFSNHKYKRSIRLTLRAARLPAANITPIINDIESAISVWLSNKSDITSRDIRIKIAKELTHHSINGSIIYKSMKEKW